MDELLNDILAIEALHGIVYFSFEGKIVFQYYKQNDIQNLDSTEAAFFAGTLDKIEEAEFVFENAILYVVRGRKGYLLAVLSRSAPVALVRLNANILLAALDKESSKPRGLARFLKRQP